MKKLYLVSIGTLLCLPLGVAYGMTSTIWDFQGSIPAEIGVQQLTNVTVQEDGLHIETTADGFVYWKDFPLLNIPTEAVTVYARSNLPTQAAWMWHIDGTPEGQMVQLYFDIPESDTFEPIHIDSSLYPQWDHRTERIGIAFPGGTETVIQQIQFQHWSLGEKMVEAWKSFWSFDRFGLYSINFLWGPLVAFNTVARLSLYDILPPTAWSAMRLAYGLIIVIAVGSAAYTMYAQDKKKAKTLSWKMIIGCIAILWIVLDLRMGLEILSYAKTDLDQFVFSEKKILRDTDELYETMNSVLPDIRAYKQYVLFSTEGQRYDAHIRYHAYPVTPLRQGEPISKDVLWVIIDRPDLSVNNNNVLIHTKPDGSEQILSPEGAIVKKLDDDSFLFVTTK